MGYLLTINDAGDLEVQFDATSRILASADEYNTFFQNEAARLGVDAEELTIMRSSSLDFADEYTDKPEVLALVAQLS